MGFVVRFSIAGHKATTNISELFFFFYHIMCENIVLHFYNITVNSWIIVIDPKISGKFNTKIIGYMYNMTTCIYTSI